MTYERIIILVSLFAGCLMFSSCTDSTSKQSQLKPKSPSLEHNDGSSTPQPKEDTEADVRKSWQKPELVITALGNIEDKTIADLGAGIGYFSFRLLSLCQKVIAIDIDAEAIEVLEGFKSTMSSTQQQKLDIRLATPDNPKLNMDEVDIVFIVNTVGFIGNRRSYISNLTPTIRQGGEIVIVDYKSKRLPSYVEAPKFKDRVYMHVLEEDLEKAGFNNITVDDTTLEYQYIITATKK